MTTRSAYLSLYVTLTRLSMVLLFEQLCPAFVLLHAWPAPISRLLVQAKQRRSPVFVGSEDPQTFLVGHEQSQSHHSPCIAGNHDLVRFNVLLNVPAPTRLCVETLLANRPEHSHASRNMEDVDLHTPKTRSIFAAMPLRKSSILTRASSNVAGTATRASSPPTSSTEHLQ